ncbi:hypothetical protein KI387_004648 [Taxus chinensis]|uniref:Uncharacterized protein n=1 Tax=Taxus chinensis TaxID=29808 RepID=A0AA38LIY6_TAXCH|nr:hypothetical protein KI387_043340 [Taxus chinensis]KAH9324470.1 hypothetical protein KI387_004648 [Taxus chinensis]
MAGRPVPRRDSPWGNPQEDYRQPRAHRCNDRLEDIIQERLVPCGDSSWENTKEEYCQPGAHRFNDHLEDIIQGHDDTELSLSDELQIEIIGLVGWGGCHEDEKAMHTEKTKRQHKPPTHANTKPSILARHSSMQLNIKAFKNMEVCSGKRQESVSKGPDCVLKPLLPATRDNTKKKAQILHKANKVQTLQKYSENNSECIQKVDVQRVFQMQGRRGGVERWVSGPPKVQLPSGYIWREIRNGTERDQGSDRNNREAKNFTRVEITVSACLEVLVDNPILEPDMEKCEGHFICVLKAAIERGASNYMQICVELELDHPLPKISPRNQLGWNGSSQLIMCALPSDAELTMNMGT